MEIIKYKKEFVKKLMNNTYQISGKLVKKGLVESWWMDSRECWEKSDCGA